MSVVAARWCLMLGLLALGCGQPGTGPLGPDGGPGGGPKGAPAIGAPEGPRDGPSEEGRHEGAPPGDQNAPPPGGGLPSLSWTPGEIKPDRLTDAPYVARLVSTGEGSFDEDVGTTIGAMYGELQSTTVKKTGPAFVILEGAWGPAMQVKVAFPVAADTVDAGLPAGMTLGRLPAGDALAVVHQGARMTLAAADALLLGAAGDKVTAPGFRVYVLLDRPDEAGPSGPKTKVVLAIGG